MKKKLRLRSRKSLVTNSMGVKGEHMKKKLRAILAICILAIALCIGVKMTTFDSKAAVSEFYRITCTGSKIQHFGDYYFKAPSSNDQYTLYYSKSKTGTYKKMPMQSTLCCTNGQVVYFINGSNSLCKYSLKTGKYTTVKKLPLGTYKNYKPQYIVTNVYNGVVYLTKRKFEPLDFSTYSYSIKEDKLKRLVSGEIYIAKKNYALVGQTPNISLVKLSKTSVTYLRDIDACTPVSVSGSYFYYAKNTRGIYDDSRQALYKIKYDGIAKPVKIATFTCENGRIIITEASSTYCKYIKITSSNREYKYKYTYSTKKSTRIN